MERNRTGLKWTVQKTLGIFSVFFFVEEAAWHLPCRSVLSNQPDRPPLADEGIVPRADAADHQGLHGRLRDLAGGSPVDHEIGPGAAPDIGGRNEDLDGRERF